MFSGLTVGCDIAKCSLKKFTQNSNSNIPYNKDDYYIVYDINYNKID